MYKKMWKKNLEIKKSGSFVVSMVTYLLKKTFVFLLKMIL